MKSITGKVTSNKMQHTVVVKVARLVPHPMYRKRIQRSKKFHAHDELGAKVGQTVILVQTKPMSRTKFWKVTEIVKEK